ncbi:hypothetical protein CK203_098349 [Vitis vinifera]|uniref:Retroviral polymerase SH3-like domain-containing protein n=1 Tax=Vitis vinifera TaxID=29760 RepID=A0A438D2I1_VITVI|nr:hypothetical protein CK203_098349 [Vitis vinifera]
MDVSLESKSLPSVGYSRKSYLQVTSQRLARGKLVHFHGWKSLALPSVGPVDARDIYRGVFPTFPLRNLMVGGLQGEEWKFIQKYLKKISKRVGAKYRKLQAHFAGENGVCEISQTLKRVAKYFRNNKRNSIALYKKAAKFSQQKADFATLWSDLLAMAVTPSFQLRIMHRLKHWILDFLSFEMCSFLAYFETTLAKGYGAPKLIIDSGATDHMTFNSDDFIEVTQPRRIDIANANGVTYPITRAGTIDDILTKEIIGHGTKKRGLYYMDDFSSSQAHHMHHASIKKRRIWITCNPWPSSRKFMCSNTLKKFGCRKEESTYPRNNLCSLLGAHVPSRYWDDAIATAVYLLNRMPSKVLQFKTLLQVLSEHVSLPTILLLPPRIFGCVAFVHLHKKQRTKLDPCVVRCIFVGIDSSLAAAVATTPFDSGFDPRQRRHLIHAQLVSQLIRVQLVIFNLGLPVKSSQEITNGCLLGVQKAYQVLAILENPTLKSPPRGSQGRSSLRHVSGSFRRNSIALYKKAAKFSQQKADFATLWSDLLAMALTPSFQLRIALR